jgi:hypothetical protein
MDAPSAIRPDLKRARLPCRPVQELALGRHERLPIVHLAEGEEEVCAGVREFLQSVEGQYPAVLGSEPVWSGGGSPAA